MLGCAHSVGMGRLVAVAATTVIVMALAGCSVSTPAVVRQSSAASNGPLTTVVLQRDTAWGECQQLVIKRLKLTDADVRKWSQQTEKPAGAAWIASGHIATGSLTYRYRCTIASDKKGDPLHERLDWIYPG